MQNPYSFQTIIQQVQVAIDSDNDVFFLRLLQDYGAGNIENIFTQHQDANVLHYLLESEYSANRKAMVEYWVASEQINIDITNKWHNTALAVAVEEENAVWANVLLDMGASVHEKYHAGAYETEDSKAAPGKLLGLVLQNLKKKSDTEIKDILHGLLDRSKTGTPLLFLLANKQFIGADALFHRMLDLGAPFNEQDEWGRNIFHLVCGQPLETNMVQRLAHLLAISTEGVNQLSMSNEYPIILAFSNSYLPDTPAVKMLLDAGADIFMKDRQGITFFESRFEKLRHDDYWQKLVSFLPLSFTQSLIYSDILPALANISLARQEFEEIMGNLILDDSRMNSLFLQQAIEQISTELDDSKNMKPVVEVADLIERGLIGLLAEYNIPNPDLHAYLLDYFLASKDPAFGEIMSMAMRALPDQFSHPAAQMPLYFFQSYHELFMLVMEDIENGNRYSDNRINTIFTAIRNYGGEDSRNLFNKFIGLGAEKICADIGKETAWSIIEQLQSMEHTNKIFSGAIKLYQFLYDQRDKRADNPPISMDNLLVFLKDDPEIKDIFDSIGRYFLNREEQVIIQQLKENPQLRQELSNMRLPKVSPERDDLLASTRHEILVLAAGPANEPSNKAIEPLRTYVHPRTNLTRIHVGFR
ncbi:MAG: hypothetical protein ACOYK8_00900 [Alphaproteobacteria bacterium]